MSTTSTATSPDAQRIWHAARGPVALAVLVVAVGVMVAVVRGGGSGGALDPRSVDQFGSRALAELLTQQGVRLQPVGTAGEAHATVDRDSTLLITKPDMVPPQRLRALAARAGELVLVAPGPGAVHELVPGTLAGRPWPITVRPARCDLAAARVAGEATMGGIGYSSERAEHRCFPVVDGSALLRAHRGDTPITLLGTGRPLTNDALSEHGNAALAMRMLGAQQRLVWYVPSPSDPALGTGQSSLLELLPDGWKFGLIQVGVAVLVLALWRACGLGPLVREPLPVVVHAAETTEGRAQLYQRSAAADHAATALRRAAADRIAGRLGLPADAGPEAVAESAAARTGRTAAGVHELLYGPAPRDDAALVRLATDLDVLENEVRTR